MCYDTDILCEHLLRFTFSFKVNFASEYNPFCFSDVSETSKALSFLKRSFHMFLATHGFQISIGKDSGARLITDSDSDDLLGAKFFKLI